MAFIKNAKFEDLEQLDRSKLVCTAKVAELFNYATIFSLHQAVRSGLFPPPCHKDAVFGNFWTVEQLHIEFYRRLNLLTKYNALLKERAFYKNRPIKR